MTNKTHDELCSMTALRLAGECEACLLIYKVRTDEQGRHLTEAMLWAMSAYQNGRREAANSAALYMATNGIPTKDSGAWYDGLLSAIRDDIPHGKG